MLGLFASLLAGCSSIPSALNPFPETPIPSSASLTPPPNPSTPRRINVLDSPRLLHIDEVYPPFLTRQKLRWDGDGLDWRLRFPSRRYAYAGFTLRRPIDVASHRADMRIVFKIRPARIASFLSIGLMDQPDGAPSALSDVWLLHHAPPAGDGWTTVSIPLSLFPAGAITREHAGDGAPAAPQEQGLHRELDWSRIQALRIISPGGRIPADEITIREIRFQRL
ncbi:MAG TPA: hypothetical protein PKE12_05335 [Kiritimatiellia bacterium]|nr:hypothetical protein [Kiritimatiellia bacterium]